MIGRPPVDPKIRFWSKVDKTGSCWVWTARCDKDGYGQFDGKQAHRTIYSWEIGEIPVGLLVCHSCDNPPCVNPSHLWLGTAKDNAQDRENKGRNVHSSRTHCLQGHEFTEENTYITREGWRQCRKCKALKLRRKYYARKTK